jgi:predicted nucleotidyltransferase
MVISAQTRADVVRRLLHAEPEIRGLGVRRLALFGSFARSEPRPDSDVDLLVEFAPNQKSFDRFVQLSDLLEERLGRTVELVTTEGLSPYIGPHILAEAEDVVRVA